MYLARIRAGVRVRVMARVRVRVRVRVSWGEGVLIGGAERGVDGTRPVRHHAAAVARAARLQPNELWQAAALATAATAAAVVVVAAAAAAIPATRIGNEGQCAVR